MEIVQGRWYRIVVRFPWGATKELITATVVRDADGTIRWEWEDDFGFAAYVDCVIEETEHSLTGWGGGCCDVTVVITAAGAPGG